MALTSNWMHFPVLLLLASDNGIQCIRRENRKNGIDRMAKAHVRMRQVIQSRQKNGQKCQRNRLLTAVPNCHDHARKGHHRNESVHENIRDPRLVQFPTRRKFPHAGPRVQDPSQSQSRITKPIMRYEFVGLALFFSHVGGLADALQFLQLRFVVSGENVRICRIARVTAVSHQNFQAEIAAKSNEVSVSLAAPPDPGSHHE